MERILKRVARGRRSKARGGFKAWFLLGVSQLIRATWLSEVFWLPKLLQPQQEFPQPMLF